MTKIKRALISVFDKTGVVEFAKGLYAMGVEILSTGGTADLFRKEGIPVREVSEVTKFPEMLNGRVKTLHPNLHGGLLALRDNPEHMETIKRHEITPIDLIAVNLYPFWDAVRTKTEEKEIIEMIDIGGPSMLRSAAKNFRFVASVSDPSDYKVILDEMRATGGALRQETLKRLAGKVFKLTSYYDGLIADYFAKEASAVAGHLPAKVEMVFEKIADLRYGENPHQPGALYGLKSSGAGVVSAKQLHGKELSFNNYLDLDAAWEMVCDFDEPSCAIIKHTNPCGFAVGKDTKDAFRKAYACDPLSAFGSIIGFNREVDDATASAILKSGFVECIIAPAFSKKAVELLSAKKNLRLLVLTNKARTASLDFKKVSGGLLVQEPDRKDAGAADLKIVTKKKPTKTQERDLLFAFKVSRYLKSNAIVIAKNGATLGMGMGQTSRVDSCRSAFHRAGKRAKGAVLASDGFFPKPDSIGLAKRHGIASIVQPGGSIQDEAVIEACNRAKISMVVTGIRHFKH